MEMMISHLNKVLGHLIDTRRMDVGVPPEYIQRTLALLKPFHTHRKSFAVKEMERVTGMLVYVAGSAPWLKFLLSHVYTSVATAVGANKAHLVRTNKQFRELLRQSKLDTSTEREATFAQAETARSVHSSPRSHWINRTLREELHLIASLLESKHVKQRTPIAHLIRRDPSATAWSDSCLYAAGGFSVDMRFWWYLD